MVHIVRKKIGKYEYLYLQKSYHIKGKNKKRTEHIAYVGRADKYIKKDIDKILYTANNHSKRELNKLLTKYHKKHKKENKKN